MKIITLISVEESWRLLVNYSKNYLGFSSRKAIKQIKNGEDGWQEMVPEGVAEMIMQNGFFGWKK